MQAHSIEEVEDFAKLASAVVINIGTVTADWVASKKLAAAAANFARKPWVLDPFGCGATSYRTRVCNELYALGPWVVRGNASEILALAGAAEGPTLGVDSTAEASEALDAAVKLAKGKKCVVAVSGPVDLVTDGSTVIEVHNGVSMMQNITGTGCSVTALCAAFCAVMSRETALEATAYALGCYGLAAELAQQDGAKGPGSLRVGLIDELFFLGEDGITGKGKPEDAPRVRLVKRSL